MAVESMRGNLSTTGRLRANLAVGGGSEVTITPTYNSGIKIADYTIDGEEGEIYIPKMNQVLLYTSNSNIDGAPFNTDLSLNENLNNFDAVIIEWNTRNDRINAAPSTESDIIFCLVSLLLTENFILHFSGYSTRWGDIKFNQTSFKFINRGGDLQPEIYKIWGIKF